AAGLRQVGGGGAAGQAGRGARLVAGEEPDGVDRFADLVRQHAGQVVQLVDLGAGGVQLAPSPVEADVVVVDQDEGDKAVGLDPFRGLAVPGVGLAVEVGRKDHILACAPLGGLGVGDQVGG